MIIYNITLKVDNDIADPWVHWMKEEHMPELMNTGLFTDCRLCRLLDQDETEGITFSAQYACDSLAAYERYMNHFAESMREKGNRLFGGKVIAFRTLMEVI